MLKHLQIENYILIDYLEIDFHEGFTVITGETGAGKSILLGALELILGNRADTQVLLEKDRKCTIEGVFLVGGYGLSAFFTENDLDYDDQLILRREISPAGKSRAFINDTPVTLAQMKDLGSRLVDIHSQNATITLNQADLQLAVLDSFAGSTALAAEFRERYEAFRSTERALQELIREEEKARSEEDYLRFQLEELIAASLQQDEQQRLEEEMNLLSNAEEIKENLFTASRALSEGEVNVLGLLAEAQAHLRKISSYHAAYADISARLESGLIELKDIAGEIEQAESSTTFDPDELTRIQERLDLIYHLQTKHRASSVVELLRIRDGLETSLGNLSSLEEKIQEAKKSLITQEEQLRELAERLSSVRSEPRGAFELEISGLLHHMGMPDARFSVDLRRTGQLTRDGMDRMSFLFSANKGHDLKPLSESASGGELSRVMLAIKAMISQKNLLPTIILDEIDNGISGDIAGRVGDILLKTSGQMQLIAITHLPQIAGRAATQFSVYKQVRDSKTLSGIRKLSTEQRVDELAKMISGREVTEAARQTARELLNQVSIFDN